VGTTVLAEKSVVRLLSRGYDLQLRISADASMGGYGNRTNILHCVPAKGTPTLNLAIGWKWALGFTANQDGSMALKSVDEITEMLALSIVKIHPYSRTVRGGMIQRRMVDVELRIRLSSLGIASLNSRLHSVSNFIVYRKLAKSVSTGTSGGRSVLILLHKCKVARYLLRMIRWFSYGCP